MLEKNAPAMLQEMSRIQHAISMRCLVVSQRSVEPELDAEWGDSLVIAEDQDIPEQLRHFLEHPRYCHSSPLISALISAWQYLQADHLLRAPSWTTETYQNNNDIPTSERIPSHQTLS